MTDNLARIREIVAKYPQKVYLVAASKTQTTDTIDNFMNIAPDFILGENRVQEFCEKYNDNYDWHFIGQLQTNKVKYIIDKVSLIHSLDRVELAKEIQKQGAKRNKIQDCLVEINMRTEITKGGVALDEVFDFIKILEDFENIRVVGLMSVLPNIQDENELDKLYKLLFQVYEKTKLINQKNVSIKYLSCGMSNDYEIALKNGANMIRLGRVLFGDRVY